MVIGVNYRLGLNPVAGIPLTIKFLYEALEKVDPKVTVIKFVPKFKIPSILFDTLYCSWLVFFKSPSVFHAPSFILPLLKPKTTKYVVTIHDLAFLVKPEVATWYFRFVYKLLTRYSLGIADKIIAVSENTKKDILKYYPTAKSKVTVIPNGISPVYLKNKLQPRPLKDKYLLTVSTHPYRKNTFMLLQAFSQLAHPSKLVIAGNLGDFGKRELLLHIASLKLEHRVILTGRLSDAELSAYYQHAELFIYPSTYEGFGLPLLEAMSSGCLVLGANTSSLPEVVLHQVCLFAPVTVTALVSQIQTLLALPVNKRNSIISSHQLFSQTFTWEKTAKKFLQEIR